MAICSFAEKCHRGLTSPTTTCVLPKFTLAIAWSAFITGGSASSAAPQHRRSAPLEVARTSSLGGSSCWCHTFAYASMPDISTFGRPFAPCSSKQMRR